MRNHLTAPLAALAVCVLLAACSGDDEPAARDGEPATEYVLKEQTRAIDKAREVERTLGEAAAKRQGTTQ